MKSFCLYILNVGLLCCYIYNIKFTFLPLYCRRIFFLLGFLLFMFKGQKNDLVIMGNILKLVSPFLIAMLLVGTVHIVSGEFFDVYYMQVIITIITSLFSVYFVYCMLSQACSPPNLYQYLITCIIGAILLNNICAFTAVIHPSIYDFLQSIQEVAADQDRLMNASGEMHRIMGLG